MTVYKDLKAGTGQELGKPDRGEGSPISACLFWKGEGVEKRCPPSQHPSLNPILKTTEKVGFVHLGSRNKMDLSAKQTALSEAARTPYSAPQIYL